MVKEKEKSYLDSFTASTAIVPVVIDRLIRDLQEMRYPREEIDEIIEARLEEIFEAIKKELPEDFQSAEYLLEHGFLDFIVDRADLKDRLDTLLNIFQKAIA